MENVGASGWKLQPELARLLEDRIRCRRRGALEGRRTAGSAGGMQMLAAGSEFIQFLGQN